MLSAGPVDGPLVLLLHGFLEISYGWRPELDLEAGRSARVPYSEVVDRLTLLAGVVAVRRTEIVERPRLIRPAAPERQPEPAVRPMALR